MFEHCWLIVLRGKMLRRLPAGLLRRDRLPPPPALRQRPAAPRRARRRTSRSSRCAPASSTTSLLGLQLAFLRARRAPARAAALLRARHLGDGRLALELPAPRACRRPGTRPRGRGDERGRGRRARPRVPDQDARQPLPRRTADALPDPAVPARGRARAARCSTSAATGGAGRSPPRAPAAAPTGIDRAQEVDRRGAAGGRAARRRRRVRASATRASSRSPDASLRRRLLLQRAPASRQGGRARAWSPRSAGCCGPAGSSGSRCRTRAGRSTSSGRSGAASPRAPGRTSATGRVAELRDDVRCDRARLDLGRRLPDDQPAAGRPRPAPGALARGRARLGRAAPGVARTPRSSSTSPTASSSARRRPT